ncbi:MAG: hypothetical protein Q9195_008852 [Heterodermia aff. obscurata]
MFLPRMQTKLLALFIIVGFLWLITVQWGAPSVPSSFSSPFSNHDTTSAPSDQKAAPSAKAPVAVPTKASQDNEASKPKASPAAVKSSKPTQKASKPKESPKHKAPLLVVSTITPKTTALLKEPASSKATSTPDKAKPSNETLILTETFKPPTLENQIAFWKVFEKLLDASKPDCDPPSRMGTAETIGYDKLVVSEHPSERADVLSMPDKSVAKMKKAHENFVAGLQAGTLEMVYTPGTRGLVTTAGGPYLPVFVISLRMLRRTGTNLPMEVFLADKEEYEEYICDEVFPELNAKCVVLSDILEAVPHSLDITHYQYKVFAMIFSSFEEVLFLDSDAFALHDADELFTSEPFTNHGLVSWPDFWASSASPLYYNISSQPVPPMSLRQSTESGELLLNKKTHSKSLLLATYYNYFGAHYYVLFSQGAPGEGDKETFLAAANALNETFYATSENVRPIGHMKHDGKFTGSAMVQYDPIQDYNLTQNGIWRIINESAAPQPRPFFLHVNFPRLNPTTVFDDYQEHTRNVQGKEQRIWQSEKDIKAKFGKDIEKEIWQEVKYVSCELEDKFETFKGKKGLCDKAKKHYLGVFGKT